jgi:hypothetical protein
MEEGGRKMACLSLILGAALMATVLLLPQADAFYNVPKTPCYGIPPDYTYAGGAWAGWTKTAPNGDTVPGFYYYCPSTGVYCEYGDDCYAEVTGGPDHTLSVPWVVNPQFFGCAVDTQRSDVTDAEPALIGGVTGANSGEIIIGVDVASNNLDSLYQFSCGGF